MYKLSLSNLGKEYARRTTMLAAFVVLSLGAFAQVTLTHVEGKSGRPLAPNKAGVVMQQVHEDWRVIYATAGNVTLERRNTTFTTYARWYDYTTDRAVANNRLSGVTGGTSLDTDKGEVRYVTSSTVNTSVASTATYNYSGSGVVYIACDQSAYSDFVNGDEFVEPTLSQRIVYEIRPASEIAAKMDAATGDNWMEEHHLIAPTGRTLHIGPDYMIGGTYGWLWKREIASNYFYNAANPTCANRVTVGGGWFSDGTEIAGWKWNGASVSGVSNAQFLTVKSNNPGTVEYKLTYQLTDRETGAPTAIYNVAKFVVTYMDKQEVGPYVMSEDISKIANLEPIAEERFNYVDGPTLAAHEKVYYTRPFGVDESTFGFYYGSDKRQNATSTYDYTKPYFNEYALVTTTRKIYDNKVDGALNNHTFATDTTTNGYLVYVDGSEKVGRVFSLNIPGMVLCSGATMYFSAFVADYSGNREGKTDLDFIVMGIKADGTEEKITTFTTGEFLRTNKDDLGIATNKSNDWLRVLFPITFESKSTFREFRLVITNKCASEQGNDFMIDDIQVFMKPTSFTPIEATTSQTCLSNDDPLVLYTKVDYAKMGDFAGKTLYYRWLNESMEPIDAAYMNKTYSDGIPTGAITLPATFEEGQLDQANNALVMTFEDFNDDYSAEASASHIAYIFNGKTDEIELDNRQKNSARYSLFIATPIPADEANQEFYTCLVSTSLENLNDEGSCTNSRTIAVERGLYIKSEAAGEVMKGFHHEVCPNYGYDLSYLVKYVVFDGKEGTVSKESRYVAHWLYADSTYVNANPDLFGADFRTIQNAIMHLVVSDAVAALGGDASKLEGLLNEEYGNISTANGGVFPPYVGSASEMLIEKLRERGLLVLASDLSDPYKYLAMPLGESNELRLTAFPILRDETDAPECLTPQSIVLTFNSGNTEETTIQRHTVTFVKDANEGQLPDFVTSRPRRVRILEGTTQKSIQVRLSETANKYTIVNCELFSINGKAPSSSAMNTYRASVTVKGGYDFQGNSTFDFELRNTMKANFQYVYKVTYRLKENNTLGQDGKPIESCGETQTSTSSFLHEGEAYVNFIVTPKVVTFNPEAVDGSWNDDASFTSYHVGTAYHIAPLEGTSVIVNAGSHIIRPAAEGNKYQEATADKVDAKAQPYITYDIDYKPYTCRNIHFAAGADLLGQEHLDVQGEWSFDMRVPKGGWVLSAVPLQGILTGDMYIPAKGEPDIKLSDATDKFEAQLMSQNPGEWAADRIVYSLYNSFYNFAIANKESADSTTQIGTSSWSAGANSLNTVIQPGMGWALRLETDKNGSLIRLPKRDDHYSYFRDETWVEDFKEEITRQPATPYLTKEMAAEGITLTLTNDSVNNTNGRTNFLLGNPTFACIDVKKLIEGNNDILTGSYYFTTSSEAGASQTAGVSSEWEDLSTDPSMVRPLLEPLRSIFLEAETTGTQISITITPDMLTTKEEPKAEARTTQWPFTATEQSAAAPAKKTTAADAERAIFIQAKAGRFTSSAVLLQREEAENGVVAAEDAEVFLLDAPKTPFAIYTVADDKALAINTMASQTVVPLAFYAQQNIGMEVLTFTGDKDYLEEWDLVDNRTGVRKPLTDGFSLTLSLDNRGAVRYYLEHSREQLTAPSEKDDIEDAEQELHGYVRDGQLTIYSSEDMLNFCLYDAAGRLIAQSDNAGRMQQFHLANGVYVVRTAQNVLKAIVK